MTDYHQTRNRLSLRLFTVTETIASYQWDTASIQPHLRSLSAAMATRSNTSSPSTPPRASSVWGDARRLGRRGLAFRNTGRTETAGWSEGGCDHRHRAAGGLRGAARRPARTGGGLESTARRGAGQAARLEPGAAPAPRAGHRRPVARPDTVEEAAPKLHKAAHFARKAAGADAVVLRGRVGGGVPRSDRHDRRLGVRVRGRGSAACRRRGDAARRLGPLHRRAPPRRPLRRVGRPRPASGSASCAPTCFAASAAGATSSSWTPPTRRPTSSSCAPTSRGATGTVRCASSSASTARSTGSSVSAPSKRGDLRCRDALARPRWWSSRPPARPTMSSLGPRRRSGAHRPPFCRQSATGADRSLLISGPPGIGKSALLAWARAEADALGWRTGAGAAASIEGAWPYAPILEAIADLGRRHPSLLDGLDDNYRVEIERALAGGDLHWSGEGGHQRLFVAVAELLRLAAADHGALLVLDDLHDADDASLRLTTTSPAAPSPMASLLVIAHRSGPLPPAFAQFRASVATRAAAVTLELAPLETAAVRAARPTPPTRRPGRHRGPHRRARRGICRSRWSSSPAASAPPGLGAVSRHGRFRRARSPVRGRSCNGWPSSERRSTPTSSWPSPTSPTTTPSRISTPPSTSGVIEHTGTHYHFRHGLLRDALTRDVAPHRRRRIHRDAAERLEALGASPAPDRSPPRRGRRSGRRRSSPPPGGRARSGHRRLPRCLRARRDASKPTSTGRCGPVLCHCAPISCSRSATHRLRSPTATRSTSPRATTGDSCAPA